MSDEDDDMTLCDLCSNEYPLDESDACTKCKQECCPDCREGGVCRECQEETDAE
jgi:hypothetical protein